MSAGGVITPMFITSLSGFAHEWDVMPVAGPGATKSFTNNNRCVYCPFSIPWPYPVRKIFLHLGASVAGNYDVGLYTAGGARIYSIGSTATTGLAGTVAYTTLGTDLVLSPGSYFFGVGASSNACQFQSITPSALQMRQAGWVQESTFALPASMTPAAATTELVLPLVGITRQTAI